LIGAQRLASLSLGSHIFSPEPTPMELPIEGLDPQLVDQYIQQKNLLSKAVNERWPKDMWDGYGDSAMFYARNAVKAPVRIFLQFQADPKTDGGWANLTVIDSEGKSVGNYGGGLGNSFDPQKYSIARAKVNASSVKEAGITLSPVETQLMDRYSNVAKKPTAPSQAVVDLLTSPEQHDPFTIFFSTILLADAANENRNLIASGADLDWRFARATNGLVKPSVYELSLGGFRRATIDRPDGWLVVRSMNPINASDTRLARQALGNFTRAWRKVMTPLKIGLNWRLTSNRETLDTLASRIGSYYADSKVLTMKTIGMPFVCMATFLMLSFLRLAQGNPSITTRLPQKNNHRWSAWCTRVIN